MTPQEFADAPLWVAAVKCTGSGRFLCLNGLTMKCRMFLGACPACGWAGYVAPKENKSDVT